MGRPCEEEEDIDLDDDAKSARSIAYRKSVSTGWCCCICDSWSHFTARVHALILAFVVHIAVHAAQHPRKYVVGVIVLSLTLFVAGLTTNYNMNTSQTAIFAPANSNAKHHSDWIQQESGFPEPNRIFTVSVHADGANVLHAQSIRRLFEVLDVVINTPGYQDHCSTENTVSASYGEYDSPTTCEITGVTQYFQHNIQIFDAIYQAGGDDAILRQLSSIDDGNITQGLTTMTDVETEVIFGKSAKDSETGLLLSAQSFSIFFSLLDNEGVLELEALILERMASLQAEWNEPSFSSNSNQTLSSSNLKLEYVAFRSYSDEFIRAIAKDLPLLPGGFLLMSFFTCLVFFKWGDSVNSRCLLGVGAVFTILLALLSSFGLLFIIGVPYTSLTQVLPFVIFGKHNRT
jgi:Patched family